MNNTTDPSQPSYFTEFLTAGILLVEAVVIVVTNLLVYVLFARHKQLQRKTNYCLISLATSDLLAGLVICPLVAAVNIQQVDFGPHFDPMLITMDLLQRFVAFSSVLHILLATAERFFKIKFPLHYHVFVTWKRVVFALVTVWVFSLTISLVLLVVDDVDAYRLTCMIAFAWLPFLVILIINIYTIWILDKGSTAICRSASKNAKRDQRKKRKQRRALAVYLSMAVSFAIGCLPYLSLPVLLSNIPLAPSAVLLLMKFCTSFVNPLLYTFFKTDFKEAFNATFRKNQACALQGTQRERLQLHAKGSTITTSNMAEGRKKIHLSKDEEKFQHQLSPH